MGPVARFQRSSDDTVFCSFYRLLQKLYEGTPNKPAACDKIKLKSNSSQAPFKQVKSSPPPTNTFFLSDFSLVVVAMVPAE
jgi:hypothetical protein